MGETTVVQNNINIKHKMSSNFDDTNVAKMIAYEL
jgi:hypothetical protein